MTEIRPEGKDHVKTTAFALGLAGLIPFFAAAFLALFHAPDSLPLDVRFMGLAYGAIILSFLGGIRWGMAISPMTRVDRARDLAASVLPSLLGWIALFLPLSLGLGALIVGFALQYAWDYQSWRRGHLSGWFHTLRLILSSGAIAALGLMAVAPALGLDSTA